MRINYSDFIRQISKHTGYAQKDVREVLDTTQELLQENLVQKNTVVFLPNITVEVTEAKERVGHNPQTGESMVVPAHGKLKFKAGSKLKNAVK